MVREYFKQLNLDKLPSKVSNYISQEILTDLGLDLLSEDDELFKKVKNKIDSILQKEEVVVSEEVSEVESVQVKSLRNDIKDMVDMRSLYEEGSNEYESISNDIKDIEDMIKILK